MLRRGVFALALVVVTVLMLRPVSDVSSSNDKVDHLIVFGALTLLGLWARVSPLLLMLGLTGYAVLTEVAQATLTSSRRGDPRDVLADVIGVLLVLGSVRLFRTVRGASTDRPQRLG